MIGMSANLQSSAKWTRLRLASVLLGLALPLALAVAITAFFFHASDQAVGIQGGGPSEIQAIADDDRTHCIESHKVSDSSCIVGLGCVACTVLPQDAAVVAIQASTAVRPFSPSVQAQMRIYPVHQPPEFVST
ncbi:hypothetical protein [Manganibacter manganicus]|uniref:DUF2946 domain-containing protein n=1 Tax=Manganibacter manganicus TaxID=1873176 RepID=A0A1V8RJR6_9HYPH|nr:hypothetical protein [Pseudaminobacter manganicus]OQM73447.1 hypothetical protein BFN67_09170 [Pseudaminobacter manganicus]